MGCDCTTPVAGCTALGADHHAVTIKCTMQASHIPAFYVAFVLAPFASNASELVSSLIFASRKQKKNISLTFSQASSSLSPCIA
jgi:hypothetical protein